jgi:hypothetical protein
VLNATMNRLSRQRRDPMRRKALEPMKIQIKNRLACVAMLFALGAGTAAAQDPQSAPNPGRPVGTVKAVSGSTISLTTDAKADVTVRVEDATKILRLAADQKDLRQATPATLQDVQVGDRMLASGTPSTDGKTVTARTVVIMKKADVAQKQERDVEEWNRHGVGGLVKAVDTGAGTITLATSAAATAKPLTLHVKPTTIIRRYAADSIKFDDARKATLPEINAGDQLRARGARNADGSEVDADEIVAGTFRNLSGTIDSIDPEKHTLTIKDLATKKNVIVAFTPDSRMHQLPAMVAQMMAARLRGAQGENANGAPQGAGQRPPGAAGQQFAGGQGRGPGEGAARQGAQPAAGGGRGRGGDLNQMLGMLPAVTLEQLQKGEAVMIVTTQGTTAGVTAITLLSGVEPILTAAPNAMVMTPWNLGGGGQGEQ